MLGSVLFLQLSTPDFQSYLPNKLNQQRYDRLIYDTLWTISLDTLDQLGFRQIWAVVTFMVSTNLYSIQVLVAAFQFEFSYTLQGVAVALALALKTLGRDRLISRMSGTLLRRMLSTRVFPTFKPRVTVVGKAGQCNVPWFGGSPRSVVCALQRIGSSFLYRKTNSDTSCLTTRLLMMPTWTPKEPNHYSITLSSIPIPRFLELGSEVIAW